MASIGRKKRTNKQRKTNFNDFNEIIIVVPIDFEWNNNNYIPIVRRPSDFDTTLSPFWNRKKAN